MSQADDRFGCAQIALCWILIPCAHRCVAGVAASQLGRMRSPRSSLSAAQLRFARERPSTLSNKLLTRSPQPWQVAMNLATEVKSNGDFWQFAGTLSALCALAASVDFLSTTWFTFDSIVT